MKSIGNKLIVIISVIIVTVMSLSFAYLYSNGSEKIEDQVVGYNLEISRLHAQSIHELISRHLTALEAWNTHLSPHKGDISSILDHLKELDAVSDYAFLNLFYVAEDGSYETVSNQTGSVADRAYYETFISENPPYIISDAVIGRASDLPIFAVLVSANGGKGDFEGAIAGSIEIENLLKVTSDLQLENDSYAWILDSTGVVIAHPNRDLVMNANSSNSNDLGFVGLGEEMEKQSGEAFGVIEYYDSNTDVSKIVTYRVIPETPGWKLGISTPKTEVLSAISDFSKISIITLVFTLCLILPILSIVIKKLVKPIVRLTEYVDDYTEYKEEIRALPEMKNEIGRLNNAFKHMIETVEMKKEELEHLVAQRTEALKVANTNLESNLVELENRNMEFKAVNTSLTIASKVAKIGFWEFDPITEGVDWSESIYDIFEIGERDKPINFSQFLMYLSPENQKRLSEEFRASIKEGREYSFMHPILTYMKNIKYVEERAKHEYDENGNHIKTIGSVYDITDQHISEEKFKTLLTHAADGVHILDSDGNVVMFSNSFADNLGYSLEEAQSLNVRDWDATVPGENVVSMIKDLMEEPRVFETKHRKKDGTVIDVQINAAGVELAGVHYLYASQRDISVLKDTERKLSQKSEEYQIVFNGTQDAMFLVEVVEDHVYRYIQCNHGLLDKTGYTFEQLINSTPQELLGKEMGDTIAKRYGECVAKKSRITYDEDFDLPGGHRYWKTVLTPIIRYGKVTYLVGSSSDITARRELEIELLNNANYDKLTNLPNRRLFFDRFERMILENERDKTRFALLYVDVNDFKSINDKYGHNIGDEVLIAVGRRLSGCVRKSDTVGRIGGDEFTVLLRNIKESKDVNLLIAEMHKAMKAAIRVDSNVYYVTISIGFAIYPDHGEDSKTLLKSADASMYEDKKDKKSRKNMNDHSE